MVFKSIAQAAEYLETSSHNVKKFAAEGSIKGDWIVTFEETSRERQHTVSDAKDLLRKWMQENAEQFEGIAELPTKERNTAIRALQLSEGVTAKLKKGIKLLKHDALNAARPRKKKPRT